jgi:hypothetical protein
VTQTFREGLGEDILNEVRRQDIGAKGLRKITVERDFIEVHYIDNDGEPKYRQITGDNMNPLLDLLFREAS